MRLLARALAALAVGAGTWCSLGSPAVLETSGLARAGILPPWWVLAACVGVALIVAGSRAASAPAFLPFLIFPLFLLPWLPGAVPVAFLLWTGRLAALVIVLALTAAVLALPWRLPAPLAATVRDPRRAPLLGAAAALVVFLAGAGHLQGKDTEEGSAVPGGDEPHYLVITQSLLLDGDLRIENNHQRRDYLPYFRGTLRPHYLRRGTDQQIYSIHLPGISVVVLPAFALAGYPGAVVLLSLLAAMGTALVWRLAWRLTTDAGAAWFGWATTTLSTPFTIQAFSIYPEATASVLTLTGVAALILPVSRSWLAWLAHGAALGLLPWLHARHAVLAGLLGLFIVWRLAAARAWSRLAAFAAVPAVCALGWFAYFWVIYGSPSPAAPYGGLQQTVALAQLPLTVLGLLFDQQYGLLAAAPALGIAVLGVLVLAWKPPSTWAAVDTDTRLLGLQLVVLFAACTVMSASHRMWWAGSSSPARFLVAVVPLLGLGAAAYWHAAGRPSRVFASGALVLTIVLAAVLLGVERGRMAFNFRDGYALLLDWLSPVADLANAAPSMLRDRPDLARVRVGWWAGGAAAVWLALAAGGRVRAWSRGAAGLAVLWLGTIATMAAASGSWSSGQADRLRAGGSQLEATRAVSRWDGRAVGLVTDPAFAVVPAREIVRRFRLTTTSRRPQASGDLLFLANVPAGRYRFRGEGAVPPSVEVAVGRGVLVARWSADDLRSPAGIEAALPVDVRAIVLGGPAGQGGGARLWAEPLQLAPRDSKVTGLAQAAASYGGLVVYSLGDLAYLETGGVWTRPGERAEFVMVAPGRAGGLRFFVSGGPTRNACLVERNGWHERVALGPGERREVRIPGDVRTPGRIAVTAEQGFRPSEFDPRNADNRRLGCRIEFD